MLAFYTTVKNRRNFEHFFDDGAIFITPTVQYTFKHKNITFTNLFYNYEKTEKWEHNENIS